MLLVIEEALFAKLQAHCLAKPGAYEDYPWEQVAYKIAPSGKAFCFCAGMSPSITVKATLDEQAALIQHPAIEVAPYIGKHGWVQVQVRDEDELALALDLVDRSYDLVAPKPKKRKDSR